MNTCTCGVNDGTALHSLGCPADQKLPAPTADDLSDDMSHYAKPISTRPVVQCMHCGQRWDTIADSMGHPHFAPDFMPDGPARQLTPSEKLDRVYDTLSYATTALGFDHTFAIKQALFAALLAAEAGYTPAAACDESANVHWDGVEYDLYRRVCDRADEAQRAAMSVEYGESDGGRFYNHNVNIPPF